MVTKLIVPQLDIHRENSWGEKKCNICIGCCTNCKYCFGKYQFVRVRKKTKENWKDEVLNQQWLDCEVKYYKGGIMFPQSHNISPQHLNENIFMMRKILEKGNRLFCVTKPYMVCTERICNEFSNYKDTLHLCFSIGSTNSDTLKFWEEGGTTFEERLECLKLSFSKGFMTSVSSEPLLDENIDDLVEKLTPYITKNIWIGKMNNPRGMMGMNGYRDWETTERLEKLIRFQTNPQIIRHYYEKYKDNPKVLWKETYRREIFGDSQKRC